MAAIRTLLYLATYLALVQAGCLVPPALVAPCQCYHRDLHCEGHRITDRTLQKVFANISKNTSQYRRELESFSLYNSNVKSITPKMFNDVQIRGDLKLRNNKLNQFSIGNFANLYMVDVSNNVFAEFTTDMFVGLRQLRVLHVANSGLTRLGKNLFTQLQNLERLDLSGNQIEGIDLGAFTAEYDNNFRLQEIDLSGNGLKRVPDNLFRVMRQPIRIDLADNSLESIDAVFHLSPDLVQSAPIEVKLSNNSLQRRHFTNKTFDPLIVNKHYLSLDLSHNKISWLAASAFEKLLRADSRNHINLNGNPVQCSNCRNRWLFEDATLDLVKQITLETCIEATKNLQSYSLESFAHCSSVKRTT